MLSGRRPKTNTKGAYTLLVYSYKILGKANKSIVTGSVIFQNGAGQRDYCGAQYILRVMGMLIILIEVKVSRVYTYVKAYVIPYVNHMQFIV